MPGTTKISPHPMEVVSEGTMPSELRILGVDFWYSMKSRVDRPSQTVTGVTPQGEEFFNAILCEQKRIINKLREAR